MDIENKNKNKNIRISAINRVATYFNDIMENQNLVGLHPEDLYIQNINKEFKNILNQLNYNSLNYDKTLYKNSHRLRF